MVELQDIYVTLFALAAAVALALTALAWRHRETRGARPLAFLMLGVVIWCVSSALMWSASTRPQHVFWLKMMSLGTWMVPVGALTMALDIAKIDSWRTRSRTAALAIPPFALASVVWLNPGWLYHTKFVVVQVGSHTHFASVPGPLYWAFTIYAYAMIALAIAIIVQVYFRAPLSRRARPAMLLIGAAVPLVASFISESRLLSLDGLDLAPLAFLVTGTLWFTSLSRGELLDILPLARDAVVEQMSDGVVVLDHADLVADANPAALTMLHVTGTVPVGEPAETFLGGVTGAVSSLKDTADGPATKVGQAAMPLGCQDDCRYVDYKITALDTGSQQRVAHLVMLHDVTDERRSRDLLQSANVNLARSHEQITALNAKLHEQAIKDPLTTLYNRRFLDQSLPREIARAKREDISLALLLMDIDDFKHVNDDYSHSAGDAALKMVSEIVLASARVSDTVCRYGGDEFLVVMVNATTEAALSRAHDLQRTIEQQPVAWEHGECFVTVSIGVASLPANGVTIQAGISAADAALYAAKGAGRNKAVAAVHEDGSWTGAA